MDDARFDRLTRLIEERLTRRGAAFGIDALTVTSVAAEGAAAKKKGKRKNKNKNKGGKKKNRACRLGKVDDACQRDGDCCGGLFCSERIADTCQDCSYPGGGCASDDECCTATGVCDTTTWSDGDKVCCEETGGACLDSDECCAGFVCNPTSEECEPE